MSASDATKALMHIVRARYMSVRHLSDADAAIVLSRKPAAVAAYRRSYPEVSPPREIAIRPVTKPKPVDETKRIWRVEHVTPSGAVFTKRVTLKREPWSVV